MNRALSKFIWVVLGVFIVGIVIFATSRYGWRLFGFAYCEYHEAMFARNISVRGEEVYISGDTTNSTSGYVGYIYKLKDNNLYIGVKENAIFGFISRSSAFSISIQCDTTALEGIYFKSRSGEKQVWSKNGSAKYLGDLTEIRRYQSISVGEKDLEALKRDVEKASYEQFDTLTIDRIARAQYNKELVFWKGDYLAVATLRDGQKLYLKMSSDKSFFRVIGALGEYGVYRY